MEGHKKRLAHLSRAQFDAAREVESQRNCPLVLHAIKKSTLDFGLPVSNRYADIKVELTVHDLESASVMRPKIGKSS